MKAFDARWIGRVGVNMPNEIGHKAIIKALAEKVQNFVTSREFYLFAHDCHYLRT